MTASYQVPPQSARGLSAAVDALRGRGLRLSAARRLVLEALFTADGPITAEEIAGGVGGRLPRSDLASVYRNLDTFERVGLIRHFHAGHGPGRYTPAASRAEYHVCGVCGQVTALEPEAFDGVRERVHEDLGMEVRFSHFPLVGVCTNCVEA